MITEREREERERERTSTMVLEATVVLIDNSDFMINGDYKPTRLQAQAEAVNLLAGAKTGSNPENTVGILSLAGVRGPKVLATPTGDLGRILSTMQEIKPEGNVSLVQGVQIAQLALKHRQNKNQRQRIVAFIGSPLEEEEKALVKVAKKLKKNNVSIDLVSFGDEASEINATKLGAFLQAVNSNDSSHLVTIPPGTGVLSDVLLSTPVFMGDEDGGGGGGMGGVGTSAGGGGASDFEFGVDPNLDPELALALRVSMEEERARQEAQAQRERENQEGGQKEEATPAQPQAPVEMEAETKKVEENDETILQQALAMSLAPEDPITPSGAGGSKDQEAKTPGSGSSGLGAMLEDKSFVTNVLSNLPGVDVSDVNVQQVLSALKEKQSPKRSRTSDDDDDDEGGADEDEK